MNSRTQYFKKLLIRAQEGGLQYYDKYLWSKDSYRDVW